MRWTTTILTVATLLAFAGTAAAEETKSETILEKPSPRQGMFVAMGLHAASAIADDINRGQRGPAIGTGFSLRLGERIHKRFDVGIAFAYGRVGGDDPWSFGRLTAHANVYLRDRLFVHGGFGFGSSGGPDPDDPNTNRGRYGDVYTAGVGWNHYLSSANKSGGWLLTPIATVEYSRDDKFPNGVLWIGLEISHWFGVRRNQLDLSIDDAYGR